MPLRPQTHSRPSAKELHPRRWISWIRRAVALCVVSLCVAIVADRCLQWLTGLGRPVLLVHDEAMEYRLAPHQATTRRGSRIEINGLGMRSSRFPAARAAGTTLRIVVLGDSVVFGGATTDQAEIATELLADQLSDRLGAPVEVGNASAGSWGPANWLGFFRRHGSLGADLIVVVALGGPGAQNHGPIVALPDRGRIRPQDFLTPGVRESLQFAEV